MQQGLFHLEPYARDASADEFVLCRAHPDIQAGIAGLRAQIRGRRVILIPIPTGGLRPVWNLENAVSPGQPRLPSDI